MGIEKNNRPLSIEKINFWDEVHLFLAALIQYKKIERISNELFGFSDQVIFVDISILINKIYWWGGIFLFYKEELMFDQCLYEEMLSWIQENLSPKTKIMTEGIIFFKSKKDVLAFKMKWL